MKNLLMALNLFLFFLSVSCKTQIRRRVFGDFIVESEWLNDSVPNGRAIFYNRDGTVSSVQFFTNGLKNGWIKYFDSKGRLSDSVFYVNGLIDGYYYKLDTTGNLVHKGYYLRGFSLGPQYWYDHGLLKAYTFNTFEQVSPFRCLYSGDSLVVEGKPFFINTYGLSKDASINCLGVFAYLAHPPKIQCEYSLLRKDSLSSDFNILRTFSEAEIIVDTFLVQITGSKYFLKTIYFDSINLNSHVYISELH